jgi:hypothetical protein
LADLFLALNSPFGAFVEACVLQLTAQPGYFSPKLGTDELRKIFPKLLAEKIYKSSVVRFVIFRIDCKLIILYYCAGGHPDRPAGSKLARSVKVNILF